MARRKKANGGGSSSPGWLVTFSDLMTLLLTFFVLLLSMSSMDSVIISRISSFSSSVSPFESGAAGRVPQRIQLLVSLLRDPDNILKQQERIKDLLFPDEVLPPELSPGDLEKNLRILQHPEGVVIVLTEGLLFPQGSAQLDNKGKKLLEILTPVIQAVNADANISGHTDASDQGQVSNDDLSAMRAMAVLEQFLHGKIAPTRFSISGYGGDKPLEAGANQGKNRRVEILLKTTQWLGRYV